MKRFGRIVGVLAIGVVVSLAVSSISPVVGEASTRPQTPVFSKVLDRNVTPVFRVTKTQKNKLAVIAQGTIPNPVPPEGYSIPIAIRNGSKTPIADLHATGMLRGPDGKLVGSGSDQGFNPTRLLPGQIGFAFIYLQPGTSVPAGTKMAASANGQKSNSQNTYFADLAVSGANNTGQQIVGLLKNPRSHTIQGPGTVEVYCVTATGSFMGQAIGTSTNISDGGLGGGATTSFTADLYGATCPTFVIGASGFDQKYIDN
jgi:hypothetical protein